MGGERMIQAGAALHKTAAASRLRVGQQVELAVDPEKPARAFIVDLYCGRPPAAASGRCSDRLLLRRA